MKKLNKSHTNPAPNLPLLASTVPLKRVRIRPLPLYEKADDSTAEQSTLDSRMCTTNQRPAVMQTGELEVHPHRYYSKGLSTVSPHRHILAP